MAATPLLGLLDWLAAPSARRGLHLAGSAGWRFCSYRALAVRVRRCAAGLADRGVRAGDGVALVLRSGEDFATAFFAALLVGAPVTPIAPGTLFRTPQDHRRHLRAVLDEARPRVVVTEPDLRTAAADFPDVMVCSVGQLIRAEPAGASPADPDEDRIALVQFTSGSAARPRGSRSRPGRCRRTSTASAPGCAGHRTIRWPVGFPCTTTWG